MAAYPMKLLGTTAASPFLGRASFINRSVAGSSRRLWGPVAVELDHPEPAASPCQFHLHRDAVHHELIVGYVRGLEGSQW